MNKYIKNHCIFLVMAIVNLLFVYTIYPQEKLAQTGMQFLSVLPDARAASLAGAMTTIENYSSAVFTNPAMLTERREKFDIVLTQNNWIADIRHNAFSVAYQPGEGLYGVFAVSVHMVDYGEVEGTILAHNELGYLETEIIKPNAFALGLGYAKALSEKFSVGGNIKFVNQNLGPAATSISADPYILNIQDNKLSVLAFDFGTIYKTGFKSLAFGMSVQNFSQEIRYVEESFQLPLTFNIGLSMNLANILPEQFRTQHILFSADAVHPRSHSEQVKFGLEYTYINFLSLRVGYVTHADEQDVSYGFGIQRFGFAFDYAYTPFGVFDKVQRFTLRFSI